MASNRKDQNKSLYHLLQSILEEDMIKSAVDDPGSEHPVADETGNEQEPVLGAHYDSTEPTNFEEQLGNTDEAKQNKGDVGDELLGTLNPAVSGEDIPDTNMDFPHETQDTDHPASVKGTKQSSLKVASLISEAYKALYDVVEQVNTIFTNSSNYFDTTKVASAPVSDVNQFDEYLSPTGTTFSSDNTGYNPTYDEIYKEAAYDYANQTQPFDNGVSDLDRLTAYSFANDLIKSAEIDADLVGTWLKKLKKRGADETEDKSVDEADVSTEEPTDTSDTSEMPPDIPASDVAEEVPDEVVDKLLKDLSNVGSPETGPNDTDTTEAGNEIDQALDTAAGDFVNNLTDLGVEPNDLAAAAVEGMEGQEGEEETLENIDEVRGPSDAESEREKESPEKTSSLKKKLKRILYAKIAAHALKKMVSRKKLGRKAVQGSKKAQLSKSSNDIWKEIAKYLQEFKS